MFAKYKAAQSNSTQRMIKEDKPKVTFYVQTCSKHISQVMTDRFTFSFTDAMSKTKEILDGDPAHRREILKMDKNAFVA